MEGSSEKKINQYTFAFYNLENLFDTKNDPHTLDDDFLPTSGKKWSKKRLRKKIRDLGKIIHEIGYNDISHLVGKMAYDIWISFIFFSK